MEARTSCIACTQRDLRGPGIDNHRQATPIDASIDLEVPEEKPQSFLQGAFAVAELRSKVGLRDVTVNVTVDDVIT